MPYTSTLVLIWFLLAGVGHGHLVLSSIFSDNCVLQTNAEYGARSQVFGWCEPGEAVTVAINYLPKGASYNITSACNINGYFEVTLNPLGVGSVFDILVTGSVSTNAHLAKGCEAGDVYLCGGQSNQCFSAESAFNATALVNTSHPNIRLFSVVMAGASSPQRDFNTSLPTTQCTWNHDVVKGTGYPCNQWNAATPETQGKFSAVCLFTALQIAARHTGTRPIGLISSNFGGTSINLWAPPQVYADAGCPGTSTPPPQNFGSLFNSMIAPLVHYSVRSVLFFQGEADQGLEFHTPGYYSCRFAALIKYWRSSWGMGDFPFNFVQLGPVVGAPDSGTGDLRFAQTTVLPHPGGATDITGMAAAYDLGDASSPFDSVHFRNKVVVGARLASAVLHSAFGLQNTSLLPPRVVSSAMGAAGVAVTVVVETLDGGGVGEVDGGQCTACCKGGGNLDMFQVAVERVGPWVPVTALTYHPVEGSPLLTNISVTPATPGAYTLLRFAYAPYPQCAILGNGNSLPLPAFLINISSTTADATASGATKVTTSTPAVVQAAPPLHTLIWKGTQYAWRVTDPKPPLGLNTWNAFHTNVDEVLVQAIGQALVSLGLRDLGWLYVNIDDGWQVLRNGSGYIVEDPTRFPSGMAALSAAIHASGLKFGLYTSATSLTCQTRPGSYHMEAQDAASYCAFGIDYIKVDNCGGERYPQMNTSWLAFRKGISACTGSGGRPIILSVEYCRAGQQDGCSQWVSGVADLWRTTGDVQANWASMMSNLEENNANAGAARSGKYNDPDMLTAGLAGVSLVEAQSQFSAFAVVCAPMLLSLDLTNPSALSPELLGIISNAEVIAVGQDEGRIQGVRVSPVGDTECWARPLAAVGGNGGGGGAVAVLLLNKGDVPAPTIECSWAELGIPEGQQAAVRDLVAHTALQNATGVISLANFTPHSSRLVKITW